MMPDQTMRERIAGALWDLHKERPFWVPWAEVVDPVLRRLYLRKADAVLAVITTPSEVMVERGVSEEDAHEWFTYANGDGVDCQCGTHVEGDVAEWEAHRMGAILTAALADEKEARG